MWTVFAYSSHVVSTTNAGPICVRLIFKSSNNDTTYIRTILTPSPVVDATTGTTTTNYSYVDESTNSSATGKVDFTNSAGGIVGFNGVGNVNLNAGGDVTILNQDRKSVV